MDVTLAGERRAVGAGQELAGRVALVTGAGRGLGAAVCTTLAEAGATIVACDIRGELVGEVASAITESGGEAFPFVLDVADADQASTTLARAQEVAGDIDVLINNAGIDVTEAFDEIPPEQFDRILDVNLRGPILMSRLVLPTMRRRASGHIVNVASTAAKRAWTNASAYHTSKWGLMGFSYALHAEARAYGVRVTAVVAGGMRTPFLFERFPDLDPGVLQEPANVAQAIRFVLSTPEGTVIPELMVLPMGETSWP